MEFTNFTALVRKEVEKREGENCSVQVNDVRKNNGVVLRGLTVMKDGSNISPTIYLNNYYEAYESGEATLANVVNDVMDAYYKNKVSQSVDMRYFLDFECVRKQVVYKLVNAEKNRELLKDIPHVEFLDLAIIFQCLVAKESLGSASILIHNTHMKLWEISLKELYEAAKENTEKLQGYEIKTMNDVICEIMTTENPDEDDFDGCLEGLTDSVPIYVLSSKNRVEGAACMLYANLISDFSKALDSSLYIIPSSIHELLLLPAWDTEEKEEIKNMIREINDTQVKPEEILSYSLYFYDKEKGKINIL